MSTSYGVKTKLISASDIFLIQSGHVQVVDSGNDSRGGFFIDFYPTGAGCGAPTDPVLYLQLKDEQKWTNLTYNFRYAGVAACWGFNSAGTKFGIDLAGNMATFNTGLGDTYFKSKNCWEIPWMTQSGGYVVSACNNNSNNPFHNAFKSGDFREFYMKRRRANAAIPAGPCVNLSCNSTTATSLIRISNIFIQ